MSLTLREILAARKQELETPVQQDDDSDLFSLTTIEPTAEIPYLESNKFEEPSFSLFVAAWTPFLRSPYSFNIMEARDYRKWLLSPSLYVLNSFPRIDSHFIFTTYMKEMPPASIRDAYLLSQICWEIDLTVPRKYESAFIKIIREKKCLTKNRKIPIL